MTSNKNNLGLSLSMALIVLLSLTSGCAKVKNCSNLLGVEFKCSPNKPQQDNEAPAAQDEIHTVNNELPVEIPKELTPQEVVANFSYTIEPIRFEPYYKMTTNIPEGYLVEIKYFDYVKHKQGSAQIGNKMTAILPHSSNVDYQITKIISNGSSLLLRSGNFFIPEDLYVTGRDQYFSSGSYNRLIFAPGAKLYTHGTSLSLKVKSIEGKKVFIGSFSGSDTAAPGQAGRSGGVIKIKAEKVFAEEFRVEMVGENGGPGIDAVPYTERAPTGQPGENGRSHCDKLVIGGKQIGGAIKCYCTEPPGMGYRGYTGYPGKTGGAGGNGGNSGEFFFEGPESVSILVRHAVGYGGLGGKGSPGQLGGLGGPGGKAQYCKDGETGLTGRNGSDGPDGPNGTYGTLGM